MYERILVPLDGAKFSEEMLPHAAAVARVHGTALTLMRVVGKESDRSEAEAYVQALARPLAAQGACIVAGGDVADAIIGEARRLPRTLVAMTSHGHSGLMEAMLGSVALRLVRHGGAPVLVYRPRGTAAPAPARIAQVVLPLDGTPVSETIAPQAAELARWLDAELMVVGVSDFDARAGDSFPPGDVSESSYVRRMAGDYAARYGVRVNWEVLHGDPADAIVAVIHGRNDAILAMTTHGREALQAALLGSVTAGCLRRAGVPLLVRVP